MNREELEAEQIAVDLTTRLTKHCHEHGIQAFSCKWLEEGTYVSFTAEKTKFAEMLCDCISHYSKYHAKPESTLAFIKKAVSEVEL